MAIILNDNIKINAGKPSEAKYLSSGNTVYTSISEVNTTVPISERHIGLTVNIGYDEYWYSTGVTDSDLILKKSASGSTINNVQNIGSGIGLFSGITETGVINLRSLVGSGNTEVSLSGNSLIINSITPTGETILNDNILNYNITEQTFEPYSAYTSGVTFYYGTQCPDELTRLNLNSRLTITSLRLSTGCTALTGATFNPGDLFWDSEDSTISLQQTDEVRQQIGQELLVKVKNDTAGSILNGTVVYVTGSDSGRITIAPARASENDANIVDEVLGMVTEDISAGNQGFVTTSGLVRHLNTTGFTEGDVIYLSTTTFGGLTNVKPTYPDFAIEVGIVTNVDDINGRVLIRINNVSTDQNIRGVETVNAPFTASTRSDIISAVGSGTYYLPASPIKGQQITVMDHDGDAETWNITIDGNGKNINGETQAVINTNFGSMTLIYNGIRWMTMVITP